MGVTIILKPFNVKMAPLFTVHCSGSLLGRYFVVHVYPTYITHTVDVNFHSLFVLCMLDIDIY